MRPISVTLLAALLALAACGTEADPPAQIPGNAQDAEPFTGIAEGETIQVTGTEPFWGGEISGNTFLYKTPENIDGEPIEVTRFAGRGGLSYSGETEAGVPVDMGVTPGQCSDGMSDRTYPFTVTLQLGEEQRNGCGWTRSQDFTGSRRP